MTEWQPIDTAPKDGSLFMARTPVTDAMGIVKGRYNRRVTFWLKNNWFWKGSRTMPMIWQPTEWKPLPKPHFVL